MHRLTAHKLSIFISSLAVLAVGLVAWNGQLIGIGEAQAQVLPGSTRGSAGADIRSTRHNLSPTAPSRSAAAGNASPPAGGTSTEAVLQSGEICVFCHTPHGSVLAADRPLWNRADSAAVYTGYTSTTLNASDLNVSSAILATPSKLCLSCHDGTIAIGSVSNAPGTGGAGTAAVTGFGTTAPTAPVGSMPFGRNQANADHGFTRRLGTDLRNDHPISFTYNDTVSSTDRELRAPSTSANPSKIAERTASPKPDFALTGGRVQCATCHEPHRNTQKFLVKNRLVQGTTGPSTQTAWNAWSYSDATDQICLGCHTRLGKAWAQSAHADSTVANETYLPGPAAARDFPAGTAVWQAGCLNCHDTHTVAGSRRLLREGVSSGLTALTAGTIGYDAQIRAGNAGAGALNQYSSIENTCYQCHSDGTAPRPQAVVTGTMPTTTLTATDGVPNVAAEFARNYRMPIINNDQGLYNAGNTTEVHDITDVDGIEPQTALGSGVPANRHVECTDCHNPHRVVKSNTVLGSQLVATAGVTKDMTRRTHTPANGTIGNYGNLAGGALRGAWGVEPTYSVTGNTTIWMDVAEEPTFTVKKGDPLGATDLPVGKTGTEAATYLTREYQLCFKCHSSYANGTNATDFPLIKTTARGGTLAANANGLTRYTNVAREFAVWASDTGVATGGAANSTHQGEAGNTTGTGCAGTDCTPSGAGAWDTTPSASTFNHRSWHPVIFPTGRTPTERAPGGGFSNIRAPFNDAAKIGKQTMHCSDCHGSSQSWSAGSGPNLAAVQGPHGSDNPFILKGAWSGSTSLSSPGFCGNCHAPSGSTGGFGNHVPDGDMTGLRCNRCHIAVPHGWKNKAFLVNLRCVGVEGGQAGNCVSIGAWSTDQTFPPYYNAARLALNPWARSGGWSGSNCSGCDGAMKDCATN